MNIEQQQAWNSFLSGKNVFVTGGGGVGKTYLIKKFYETYRSHKNIALTSTTGCSALLIGGITLHSFLGIGLGNGEPRFMVRKMNATHKNKLSKLDILIIDEVSMLGYELFDKINLLLKLIRKNTLPFGGIQLILSGDFCQLPVVKDDRLCFETDSWKESIQQVFYLQQIVRQKEKEFCELLNEIRFGLVSEKTKTILNSRKIKYENKNGIIPTILYPDNRNVDLINEKQLQLILNDSASIYEYDCECDNKEFKPPVPNIKLVVGCQVMLTYNLDLERGLVNGSRGVVKGFTSDGLPCVRFIHEQVVIDYNEWKIEDSSGNHLFSYYQIPLKLAWAMTVHKAQGMTLDLVETDLRNVFEYGQVYVCLSRLKNIEGVYLKGIDYNKIIANPKAIEFYNKL